MTIEVGATHLDAPQDDSPEAIADLYLARTKDAVEPSDYDDEEDLETTSDEEDTDDEDAEEPSDSDDDSDDEGTEEADESEKSESPAQKKRVDDDEALVTVRFNDEDREVSVKDLKRLYGQEQALNRKSVEASETKKQADDAFALAATALKTLYERAERTYKDKYEGVNFQVVAAREGWTADDWEAATRMEEQDRQNLHFLHDELQHVVGQERQQRQQAEHAQKVKYSQETRKALFDPVHGIKGFTDDKLNELGHFAINELGIDRDFVATLATQRNDAPLVVALNELFDLRRSAKIAKNALTTKTAKSVTKTPGKVVKSPSEPARKPVTSDATKIAKKRLAASGSVEDAVALVMSRMRDD